MHPAGLWNKTSLPSSDSHLFKLGKRMIVEHRLSEAYPISSLNPIQDAGMGGGGGKKSSLAIFFPVTFTNVEINP